MLNQIAWSLFMKMNLPIEEAKYMLDKMREKGMGYLFEHAEKMDIQAERNKTLTAQQEAELQRNRADSAEKEAETQRKEAEHQRNILDTAIKNLILREKTAHTPKDKVLDDLQILFQLGENDAREKIEAYWEK